MEVMDARHTPCPRLPVWEEAHSRGLVKTRSRDRVEMVEVTAQGRLVLEECQRHA